MKTEEINNEKQKGRFACFHIHRYKTVPKSENQTPNLIPLANRQQYQRGIETRQKHFQQQH